MPHNNHFLWASAAMEGRSAKALAAAAKVVDHVRHHATHFADQQGLYQHFMATPFLAQIRFERWGAILATPRPEGDYLAGMWMYARTRALAATGKLAAARESLAGLERHMNERSTELHAIAVNGPDDAFEVLELARDLASGGVYRAAGRGDAAVLALKAAVVKEDALAYMEPATWPNPTRYVLGRLLLEEGRSTEAEQAFREDLRQYPKNGWSLDGLAKSLRALGRVDEAEEVEAQYREAWRYADVTL